VGTQGDDQLQISYPDGEDPTIFGTASISSATRPCRQGASKEEEEKIKDEKFAKFAIPPSWWEPCVWWLNSANGPKAVWA